MSEINHLQMPCVLTVAGSDSSGGAGIQADLKTFTVLGCYGMSVITALTAQNTQGVSAIYPVSREFVRDQLEAVSTDIPFRFFKTGMLFNAQIIEEVASFLDRYPYKKLILDPVMVSKSGHHLLQEEAVHALKKELLPRAWLVTPNLPESEILSGIPVHSEKDFPAVCQRFRDMGVKNLLIKGGHLSGNALVDLLCTEGGQQLEFISDRLSNPNTHGTGCTLSAAIVSFCARGLSLPDAVASAREFIFQAIRLAPVLGHGVGPTDHIGAGKLLAAMRVV